MLSRIFRIFTEAGNIYTVLIVRRMAVALLHMLKAALDSFISIVVFLCALFVLSRIFRIFTEAGNIYAVLIVRRMAVALLHMVKAALARWHAAPVE
jgi:hypothetical protein